MEFRTLRSLFDSGMLDSAVVAPAPLKENQYHLFFIKQGGGNVWMTKARKAEPKTYKSLDSASHDAVKVGFRKITVELPFMMAS